MDIFRENIRKFDKYYGNIYDLRWENSLKAVFTNKINSSLWFSSSFEPELTNYFMSKFPYDMYVERRMSTQSEQPVMSLFILEDKAYYIHISFHQSEVQANIHKLDDRGHSFPVSLGDVSDFMKELKDEFLDFIINQNEFRLLVATGLLRVKG